LIDIAGHISDEFSKGNEEYEKLISQLTNDKSLSDYQNKSLLLSKKNWKDLKTFQPESMRFLKSKPFDFFVNLNKS
jgi:hypothetical protein